MRSSPCRPKQSKRLAIPCTQEEFDTMMALWRQTTSPKFTEYARKVLQNLPVVTTYRNLSMDRLIDVINGIREDLGKLIDSPALTDNDKERLDNLLRELKQIFYQIADLCIQK